MDNQTDQTEEILTDETRKLVGYLMPILEFMQVSKDQKQSVKKILWKFKDNLKLKLNQEKQRDDEFNQ